MPPKAKKVIEKSNDKNNDRNNDKKVKIKEKEKEKEKKNQHKKLKREESSENESDSSSDSDQSTLSDVEYIKKDEKNMMLQGGDEDDKLDVYDDEKDDDEDKEDDEDEDKDEDEDEDKDEDKEEKENIQKNEGDMKDDEDDLDCVYRHTKKGMALEDEDIDEDEDHFIEDEEDQKETKYVSDEDRITTTKLTKYERVNIIGTRAKQIELGAQKMVKNTKGLTPKQIAKLELEMKVCPIIIKRVLPSGAVELIDVNTLEMVN